MGELGVKEPWKRVGRAELSEMADVRVKAESGPDVSAHRFVLAASSPFFAALFRRSPSARPLPVPVPVSILDKVLGYAYSGLLEEMPEDGEELEDMVRLADYWTLGGLLALLAKELEDNLSLDNVLAAWRLCNRYPQLGITGLTDKTKASLLYHLELMLLSGDSEEAQTLSADELEELLGDDWLRLENEDKVESMVRAWAAAGDGREGDVERLLRLRRPRTAPPRHPLHVVMAFGGWTNGAPTSLMDSYNLHADNWHTLEQEYSRGAVEGVRAYHGMAQVEMGGLVYLVGGFDGNKYLNSLETWDPVRQERETKACMHQARCYVSVAVLEGEVYALGGFDGRYRLRTVEKYNPVRNQWTQLPPMSRERSDAAAVSVEGKVYVMGGFDGRNVLGSVEWWSPGQTGWVAGPALSSPRSGLAGTVLEDTVWVYGGFDGQTRLSSGERLGVKGEDSGRWVPAPPMPTPRSNLALLALPPPNAGLLAIGGYNGHSTDSSVERLSIHSGEWTPKAPLPTHRSALKAIIVPNLPIPTLKTLLNLT